MEVGRFWGPRIGGWLAWADLLKLRRVVLLAEASSGKTVEFRHQCEVLASQGRAAFYVRIEDLADDGFENALEARALAVFNRWRGQASGEDGWFFLDSVDEARLNHKSLEKALRRFARELAQGTERARIYVSCRVSDWRGQHDRDSIERLLPAWKKPNRMAEEDPETALLEPIFPTSSVNRYPASSIQSEPKPEELLIVQLAPLSYEQRRLLAMETGIEHAETFTEQIERLGLDALAQRPGDLLDLAEYWKTHGRFASLSEMTEYGVAYKLSEQDRFRPDNRDISSEAVRQGVERLAAALTLTKSFTLRAPGQELNPALAPGALNPDGVLQEWSDAQRNALYRRGVFAPSTYGRIRFHHRGTQEYLTACWLHRLLVGGCPLKAVRELIFVERYGIKTLVPSLHAAAAWLALRHSDIRDEIICREPLVLLRHGDPSSLPQDAKARLLLTYAERHRAGEIGNDSLDHRTLWLFASPDLAKAIRESWIVNDRWDFRHDLLRMVIEGRVVDCADLARSTLVDDTIDDDYVRMTALDAVDACGDMNGLSSAAQWLLRSDSTERAQLVAHFVGVLFPRELSIEQLIDVLSKSAATVCPENEGLRGTLADLWRACPDDLARQRLIAGIGDLCFAPPFVDDEVRISARYIGLSTCLPELARVAVEALGVAEPEPSDSLVRLLMAVERVPPDVFRMPSEPKLGDLVHDNPQLQRHLFWADVAEVRRNGKLGKDRPAYFWELHICGGALWHLGPRDLPWLYGDLVSRSFVGDRRVALSAIVNILRNEGGLQGHVLRLREHVTGSAELEGDLARYLIPPSPSEHMESRRKRLADNKRAYEESQKYKKQSWIKFRDDLAANAPVLRDAELLADWTSGGYRLGTLTTWLRSRTKKGVKEAAFQWRLLEEGFGRPVAEAYRNGMMMLWRLIPPERPKHASGNGITTKYTTILSFAGLELEANEDPDWASRLRLDEVERATLHACISEQGYPSCIDALAREHPVVVLPILAKSLREEWSGRHGRHGEFFAHYAWSNRPIAANAQQLLFEAITGRAARDLEMLDRALRILARMDLEHQQWGRIASLSLRRFRAAAARSDDQWSLRYLAMLFFADPERATGEFRVWLDATGQMLPDQRAEGAFGALFGRDRSLAAASLRTAPVAALEGLVRMAYFYVRPMHDSVHEGSFTPDARDHAEEARGNILHALVERPGADAYRALRALSEATTRFKRLAHAKAEQDGELPAWTPYEVLAFERSLVPPVKSGEDLLRVVIGALSDIQDNLDHADATSRPLVERAQDEDEVQNWLAEQLKLRAKGRYHVHREAQVAGGDKPDIIVASSSVKAEVAVEIKHGGMTWSLRDLERALARQLAARYLKPETRRHGVLVVTHHGRRTWRDPDTRAVLQFHDLIERLKEVAVSADENRLGPIEVRVFGIDVSP